MFSSKLEQRFCAVIARVVLQCFVVGMMCFGASSAVASDKLSTDTFSKFDFKKPEMDMNSDIYVNADRITARYEGVSDLTGNVVMTFSDITMLCDRATYNHKTGDVEASGNVEITSKSGGSWRGDSIAFNHKTGYGLIGTGLLRLGQFAVLADSIARDEDGVAYARNATVTSCSNEMDSWHWSITGEGRFKQKEFLELRNAVTRLWGVPVMWFPYYYRDLNTHYGWRFMPGYTSKWGAYVLTGYVYPIAGSIEDDGLLYGKTIVDLRSEYGVAAGQEFTWQTLGGFLGDDVIQRGYLSAYVARHSGDAVEDEISGRP
jgi:lipopolysaccharide assembly outer membrane protein LptD (OstA)